MQPLACLTQLIFKMAKWYPTAKCFWPHFYSKNIIFHLSICPPNLRVIPPNCIRIERYSRLKTLLSIFIFGCAGHLQGRWCSWRIASVDAGCRVGWELVWCGVGGADKLWSRQKVSHSSLLPHQETAECESITCLIMPTRDLTKYYYTQHSPRNLWLSSTPVNIILQNIY